ncbi:DUF4254 domain-containing protein [Uliginosibacterium sp. IMCC34675]|uniref:DUF4254 domain-containing protein n=2 Tax=Uliginosibacterium aquaticum TaxID=2731212 RepID=A0ABX2IBH0_9RHOO|nr:DUF4254 domain-containing protein [Uliginosibacterium aquaticum]
MPHLRLNAQSRTMTKLIDSAEIIAFHDACVANRCWAKSEPARFAEGLWQFLELNHRFNNLLWDEEDLARRKDVADSEIAANKRAIDGYNQKRNDAIERMDEVFLSALPPAVTGSRLNSETAGSMIDRISILGLKIFHMGEQTRRSDASVEHVATCQAKLERLREQRADLAACLEQLLADCAAGRAHYKVYRQFKMYNDPTLNPYLYGAKKS